MKKKLVSIMLATAMTMSLVACGSSNGGASAPADSTTTDGESATTDAAQATTTSTATDVLNIWMASEPDHLDPALNSTVDGGCLAVNSFEGLMRYNADGQLEPACAESYTVSDDGLTYTFTLRDGLKWSNGETLDASDFVYS